jgi:ribonuclease E
VDFIDMSSQRNQRAVEDRLRDAMKMDRARVQIGRISRFGLLELSRQRLRPSLGESAHQPCPRCNGSGYIRGVESLALAVLRLIGEEARKDRSSKVIAQLPVDVATYLLNEKREWIRVIEQRDQVQLILVANPNLQTPNYTIRRVRDDQVASPENTGVSYTLAAQEAPPSDAALDLFAPRIKAEEPAVVPPMPATPAPAPSPMAAQEWQETPPAAPAPVAGAPVPAKLGIIPRVLAWLGVGQSATPAAPAPAPERERERHGGRRDDRFEGRNRGQHGRGGRRDEQRRDRGERGDRADRGDRGDRGGRDGRDGRDNRGQRDARDNRGERHQGGGQRGQHRHQQQGQQGQPRRDDRERQQQNRPPRDTERRDEPVGAANPGNEDRNLGGEGQPGGNGAQQGPQQGPQQGQSRRRDRSRTRRRGRGGGARQPRDGRADASPAQGAGAGADLDRQSGEGWEQRDLVPARNESFESEGGAPREAERDFAPRPAAPPPATESPREMAAAPSQSWDPPPPPSNQKSFTVWSSGPADDRSLDRE